METHSTTANNDTSAANMSSSEGGLATNNNISAVEDEMFSTPDNHGSIPVIQPLSQSPHVPGKTPHAVMTQSKLFTATSATDDATATVTQSRDVDDDLSQITDSDSATKVEGDVNSVSKADESPSLQDSRSLDDIMPELQSASGLPSTAKPIPASNAEYSPDGNIVNDEICDDADNVDDDVFEEDETSPLISKEQHRQPKTRQHLRSRHLVTSGHSYNSVEDTQPLLEDGEEGDETTSAPSAASSSWFSNFSVRSVISCFIKIGSGIGSLILYCVSLFHPPAEEATNTVPTNAEPDNTCSNRIN